MWKQVRERDSGENAIPFFMCCSDGDGIVLFGRYSSYAGAPSRNEDSPWFPSLPLVSPNANRAEVE